MKYSKETNDFCEIYRATVEIEGINLFIEVIQSGGTTSCDFWVCGDDEDEDSTYLRQVGFKNPVKAIRIIFNSALGIYNEASLKGDMYISCSCENRKRIYNKVLNKMGFITDYSDGDLIVKN